MAAGDEASLWPTNRLLLIEGRRHYRCLISPIHWQLRSLISTDRDGILYFPTGVDNTHITRFDIKSRECDVIRIISFHPRCLVARGGWICCGGEKGEVAIIRELGPRTSSVAADSRPDQDPARGPSHTSLVPSESAPSSARAEAPIPELHRDVLNAVEQINGVAKPWTVMNYKFGSHRVNCITIWLPPKPSPGCPGVGRYTTPLAVLANNDKTVTIVNLYDGEAIDELEYPDFVNRSVISPDGKLLIAICDDPFLYIHTRCAVSWGIGGYNWVQLPRIRLKDQSVRDQSDCRGSFAACFSPSGRYLAVGTQYGTISIFDTAAFADTERDPLVTYFNSARASTDSGAVRDMAFSPGPYDILAWTEHRGRFGVADARTNFTKRQIISIEDHGAFDDILIRDRNSVDSRHYDLRGERRATSSTVHGLAGHGPLGPGDSETPGSNNAFTPEELAILDAVQGGRRRREVQESREAREQRELGNQRESQPVRGSPVFRSSVFAERVSPQQRITNVARDRDRDISARLRYLTSLQRDTLTRIFEREQNRGSRGGQLSASSHMAPEQDRERQAMPRRSSIMHSLSQNLDSSMHQTLNRLQRLGQVEATSGLLESSPSSTWGQPRSASNWVDLDTLYNISGDTINGHDGSRGETSGVRRAIAMVNDVWNDELPHFRRTYARIASREHRQHSDDTAGLAWSEDGRALYIGAEDGIYEFHVDIFGRKIFPSVTPR
ncbi:hypothetical protein GGS20DRAFT_569948 [Poronia punctata]|nr:hypothetical protein GGS20DRAFT_569948 [Poronia punctata]